MTWRRISGIALLAAFIVSISGAARADDVPVDIELVLAVDVSRSIDEDEHRLQRQGYIDALRNEKVLKAIQNGPLGAIAVTYVEWASEFEQAVLVDWTVIRDRASAEHFASALAESPRMFYGRTGISAAIDFAVPRFADNGFEGTRKVIDVSGDGVNNRGRPITISRAEALAAGITINGLPIVNDRPQPWGGPPVAIDQYFRDYVIGGPGSFLVVVNSFDTFGEAIVRKLIAEIAGIMPPTQLGQANAGPGVTSER